MHSKLEALENHTCQNVINTAGSQYDRAGRDKNCEC